MFDVLEPLTVSRLVDVLLISFSIFHNLDSSTRVLNDIEIAD